MRTVSISPFFRGFAYVFAVLVIGSHAFLPPNASALELTSNVSLVRGSYRSTLSYSAVSGFGNNCASTGSYLISGGGNDTPCYLASISLSTWDGNYSVGDFVVQELYVHNTQVNNASDVLARINSYYLSSTGNAGADLVDVKLENLNESSAKITFTSRVWQAGNIYSMTYGFQQYAAFGLYNSEWLASGYSSIWHEANNVDYSVSIGNISSALANQGQALQNIVDNTYYTHQDTASINTRVGTINGNVADIKILLQNELGGMTQAIEDGNQAAQDRYDDEKDTIEGGVSDGSDSISDLDTSFTLPNPFTMIFGNITPNTCYDITGLALMTHSTSNTYCSWFSSTTRGILTPVISFVGTIILVGFFYSWVKKGGI